MDFTEKDIKPAINNKSNARFTHKKTGKNLISDNKNKSSSKSSKSSTNSTKSRNLANLTAKPLKKVSPVKKLKSKFRKNGLNVIESYYNAYSIYFLRKSDKICEAKKTHRKNIYDVYLGILSLIAKIFGVLCFVSVKTKKEIFTLSTLTSLAAIGAVTAMIFHIYSFQPSCQIYIDGENVGILEDINKLDASIALVEKDISAVVERSYKLSADINYKIVLTKAPVYLSDTDLYEVLYNLSKESITTAYGLYIDENLVGAVLNEEDIDVILQEVLYEQAQFFKKSRAEFEITANEDEVPDKAALAVETAEGNAEADSEPEPEYFDFLNEVKVVQAKYLRNTIITSEELKTALMLSAGSRSIESLAVDKALEKAQVTNSIPREQINLFAANPMFMPRLGNIGVGSSYYSADANIPDLEIQFKKIKSETTTVEVPFEVEYIESEKYYVNTTIVESEGVNGENKISAQVTYLEDIEIARDITDVEVLKEPAAEVVIVGTKELPSVLPTGKLIFPLVYQYTTDLFDDVHRGVDFVARTGTPIVAADGGTVLYAGENPSFGLYVVIRHSNGLETLYAHMDETIVTSGEKVFQGQEIGKVGSTGNSTGPHLHFEVSIYGILIDPFDYLRR